MRGSLLTWSVVTFFSGVAAFPFLRLSWGMLILLFLLCSTVFTFRYTSAKSLVSASLILPLLFFSGMVRYKIEFNNNASVELHHFLQERPTIQGIIVTEPELTEKGWRFVVEASSVNTSGKETPISSRLLVKTGFYPEYNYGDEIKMTGTLQVPENFQSDNGRIFNYRMYLAKEKIFYTISKPAIELLGNSRGLWLKEKLFVVKQAFLGKVDSVLPEPQSALAGGLVLGVKQSLGKELESKFRTAGLIHIVVLSGYNVTIIAESFMKALSFLPKHVSTFCGAIGIVFFAIITGGTATVIRSSIMALILLLGRSIGREYDAFRALFVAGFFMVLHNPHILLYDPSFQLSFLATLGLMLVVPFIEKYFMWAPEKFGLRSIFTSTIATQIFVLPYLMYQIGDLSIIGLVVNILVLPIIPLTMLCVFLTGMTGFVFVPLSQLFSFLSYFLLAYEIQMVEVFAALPFASFSVNAFPLWVVFVLYGFYCAVLWKVGKVSVKSEVGLRVELSSTVSNKKPL